MIIKLTALNVLLAYIFVVVVVFKEKWWRKEVAFHGGTFSTSSQTAEQTESTRTLYSSTLDHFTHGY